MGAHRITAPLPAACLPLSSHTRRPASSGGIPPWMRDRALHVWFPIPQPSVSIHSTQASAMASTSTSPRSMIASAIHSAIEVSSVNLPGASEPRPW
jgi:hypothetical protein